MCVTLLFKLRCDYRCLSNETSITMYMTLYTFKRVILFDIGTWKLQFKELKLGHSGSTFPHDRHDPCEDYMDTPIPQLYAILLKSRVDLKTETNPWRGGRFHSDDPSFFYFQSDWVHILYLSTIRLTPSFYRKNQFVPITFSSRDIRT